VNNDPQSIFKIFKHIIIHYVYIRQSRMGSIVLYDLLCDIFYDIIILYLYNTNIRTNSISCRLIYLVWIDRIHNKWMNENTTMRMRRNSTFPMLVVWCYSPQTWNRINKSRCCCVCLTFHLHKTMDTDTACKIF